MQMITKRPSFAVAQQRWHGSSTFIKAEVQNRRFRGLGLWKYRYGVRKQVLAYPGYVISRYRERIRSSIERTAFWSDPHNWRLNNEEK